MFWGKRAPQEASLLSRLEAGDQRALESLYRQEAAQVYRFALAMCGNPAWSEDATQDAFVHLAQQPQAFDPAKGVLRGYLCGIARHKLLARYRESAGHESIGGEDDDDGEPDPQALTPEAMLVDDQSKQQVWSEIRALPWMFREALVLVDVQDRSYAEAAQIAGVELNTLRTRVHRARQRLAAALSSKYPEMLHE
jgi:RNA polymerase sigma-70 factor (ECF subfamily)